MNFFRAELLMRMFDRNSGTRIDFQPLALYWLAAFFADAIFISIYLCQSVCDFTELFFELLGDTGILFELFHLVRRLVFISRIHLYFVASHFPTGRASWISGPYA